MVETRSKKTLRNEPVSFHTPNRGKQGTGIVRVPAPKVKARSTQSTSRCPPTSPKGKKSPEPTISLPTPSTTVDNVSTKAPVKFDNFLQQTLAEIRTNGSTAIPFAYTGFYTPPPVAEDPNFKPTATTSDGTGNGKEKEKETNQRKRVTFQGVWPEEADVSTTFPNDGIVRDRRSMTKASYFACIRERYPKLLEVLDFPMLHPGRQDLYGVRCEVPLYSLGWTITSPHLRKIAGPGYLYDAPDLVRKMVAATWRNVDYTRDIPFVLGHFHLPV